MRQERLPNPYLVQRVRAHFCDFNSHSCWLGDVSLISKWRLGGISRHHAQCIREQLYDCTWPLCSCRLSRHLLYSPLDEAAAGAAFGAARSLLVAPFDSTRELCTWSNRRVEDRRGRDGGGRTLRWPTRPRAHLRLRQRSPGVQAFATR